MLVVTGIFIAGAARYRGRALVVEPTAGLPT
jgi:hypothetical protein